VLAGARGDRAERACHGLGVVHKKVKVLREIVQVCLILLQTQKFFGADRIVTGMMVSSRAHVACKCWCYSKLGVVHKKVKVLREIVQVCLIP